MKKYLGVKVVSAEPMSYREAGKAGLIRNYDPESESLGDGYKVVYEDGYESWSPNRTFKKAYRQIDGLSFGDAIESLRQIERAVVSEFEKDGLKYSSPGDCCAPLDFCKTKDVE
ncbi:hypothetical protein AGMMS4957_19950 [Bacteroidia bacterium]|nr:hypothetical protein AGMMS4957_19950 [Bacteroidia bacterium]